MLNENVQRRFEPWKIMGTPQHVAYQEAIHTIGQSDTPPTHLFVHSIPFLDGLTYQRSISLSEAHRSLA